MNVYVIASDGGMCKIGKANDPAARMQALYTGHPYKMTLAYMRPHPDPLLVEGAAHRLLAAKRMSGEWFNVSVIEAIEALEKAVQGEAWRYERACPIATSAAVDDPNDI